MARGIERGAEHGHLLEPYPPERLADSLPDTLGGGRRLCEILAFDNSGRSGVSPRAGNVRKRVWVARVITFLPMWCVGMTVVGSMRYF